MPLWSILTYQCPSGQNDVTVGREGYSNLVLQTQLTGDASEQRWGIHSASLHRLLRQDGWRGAAERPPAPRGEGCLPGDSEAAVSVSADA